MSNTIHHIEQALASTHLSHLALVDIFSYTGTCISYLLIRFNQPVHATRCADVPMDDFSSTLHQPR